MRRMDPILHHQPYTVTLIQWSLIAWLLTLMLCLLLLLCIPLQSSDAIHAPGNFILLLLCWLCVDYTVKYQASCMVIKFQWEYWKCFQFVCLMETSNLVTSVHSVHCVTMAQMIAPSSRNVAALQRHRQTHCDQCSASVCLQPIISGETGSR